MTVSAQQSSRGGEWINNPILSYVRLEYLKAWRTGKVVAETPKRWRFLTDPLRAMAPCLEVSLTANLARWHTYAVRKRYVSPERVDGRLRFVKQRVKDAHAFGFAILDGSIDEGALARRNMLEYMHKAERLPSSVRRLSGLGYHPLVLAILYDALGNDLLTALAEPAFRRYAFTAVMQPYDLLQSAEAISRYRDLIPKLGFVSYMTDIWMRHTDNPQFEAYYTELHPYPVAILLMMMNVPISTARKIGKLHTTDFIPELLAAMPDRKTLERIGEWLSFYDFLGVTDTDVIRDFISSAVPRSLSVEEMTMISDDIRHIQLHWSELLIGNPPDDDAV